MGLESATYINGLVSSNPTSSDGISAGDDHLRLLKATILATFPNITGAVTPTHTELNYVDGVTSAIQTQLDGKSATGHTHASYAPLADPTFTGTVVLPSTTSIGNVSAAELAYLDGVTSGLQAQLNNKAASAHNHSATDLTTGSLPDARVQQSNVTQHQAALAITAPQITVAIRDSALTTDAPSASDEENIVTYSSASSVTVTLNTGVCAIGNSIAFVRLGAGSVTFAAGSGQTVVSPGSRLTIPEVNGTVVATRITSNGWLLGGV